MYCSNEYSSCVTVINWTLKLFFNSSCIIVIINRLCVVRWWKILVWRVEDPLLNMCVKFQKKFQTYGLKLGWLFYFAFACFVLLCDMHDSWVFPLLIEDNIAYALSTLEYILPLCLIPSKIGKNCCEMWIRNETCPITLIMKIRTQIYTPSCAGLRFSRAWAEESS